MISLDKPFLCGIIAATVRNIFERDVLCFQQIKL